MSDWWLYTVHKTKIKIHANLIKSKQKPYDYGRSVEQGNAKINFHCQRVKWINFINIAESDIESEWKNNKQKVSEKFFFSMVKIMIEYSDVRDEERWRYLFIDVFFKIPRSIKYNMHHKRGCNMNEADQIH